MGFKFSTGLLAVAVAGLILASCGDSGSDDKQAKQPVSAPVADQGLTDTQKTEVAKLVRETIIANPEILQEAFAALERREQEAQARKKEEALAANAEVLFRSKLSPIGGNPDGDVTVVEFFDYNCPYCRKAYQGLVKLMEADKKVKVVFKEFPIFGGASMTAAKAALAAKQQGKYFEMHRVLLEQDNRITEAMVFAKAKEIGLDVDRLKQDMETEYVTKSIEETRKLADSLGIRGTPAFFVGDKLIPGAPENLVDLLKAKAADIRKNGCKNC
jgi:protein-disulfide isomerase